MYAAPYELLEQSEVRRQQKFVNPTGTSPGYGAGTELQAGLTGAKYLEYQL